MTFAYIRVFETIRRVLITTTAITMAKTPVIEPVIVDFVGKTIQSDPKVLSRKSSGDVGGGDGREPDRQIRLNDGVRNRRQCAWPEGEGSEF